MSSSRKYVGNRKGDEGRLKMNIGNFSLFTVNRGSLSRENMGMILKQLSHYLVGYFLEKHPMSKSALGGVER